MYLCVIHNGFTRGSVVKNLPIKAGDPDSIPGLRISCGEGWQPTPIFLPGKSHGQRSLASYSPWVAKSQIWLSSTHTHTRHLKQCVSSAGTSWFLCCNEPELFFSSCKVPKCNVNNAMYKSINFSLTIFHYYLFPQSLLVPWGMLNTCKCSMWQRWLLGEPLGENVN